MVGKTVKQMVAASAIALAVGSTWVISDVIISQPGGSSAAAAAWTSYTPTFTGMGTVASSAFYYKVEGTDLLIRGSAEIGNPTAVEARLSLPAGFTSSANIGTLDHAGSLNCSDASGANIVFMEASKTYVTFGAYTVGLSKLNGDTFLTAGATFTFQARIPL